MLIGINASSIGDAGYPKYWGENSYKKAKEFGFSCVDCSILGSPTSVVYQLDKEERNAFLLREKELAEQAGIKIHQSHATCLSLGRALSDEEISNLLNDIKTAIESCKILDCKYLVVHPFMPNGWSDRGKAIAEDTFNKNVQYLQLLSDFAQKYDVTLCLENMPCIDFSISTPEEVVAVIKKVDRENVKMCFDTGHVAAFSRSLTAHEEIKKCHGLIKVLHVHDNYGGADQHNFPGMGMIEWKKVLASLKEAGFDGVFSLELCYPDKFSEPVFETSCRLAYSMAFEIVNGLID